MRADRERKSIGAERTFEADLIEGEALQTAMEPVLDALMSGSRARARSVGR